MTNGLTINSSKGNYSINFFKNLEFNKFEQKAIIMDSYFENKIDANKVIFVEASEKNKNLGTCETIVEKFKDLNVVRGDTVVAIGGGFIQDISTLAASLYMRGIDWIFVPTTLTSMMDSCIGGKSSINVGTQKNLIGNFWPPSSIEIYPEFITTLSQEDKIAGLSEAVKICFAKGSESFNKFMENESKFTPGNNDSTLQLVLETLLAKKWFIEIDEFDKKERKLLNFGHTYGHAIESATKFQLNHGVSVAIGMLAACNHPDSSSSPRIKELVTYIVELLSHSKEYIDAAVGKIDWSIFQNQILSDKKNSTNDISLILPGENSLEIKTFKKKDEELAKIQDSLIKAFGMVKNGI